MTMRLLLRRGAHLGAPLLALVLVSCDIETVASEDSTAPADGSVGATCDDETPCDDGLVCPAGGHLAGSCSAECETDNDCVIAAGDAFYCLAGVCTQLCGDRCGLGGDVQACPGYERCLSQQYIDATATDCYYWCVP